MNIPENLKFTQDHEWIRVEGSHGTIGITDYAQGELGDIVFIEVETLDETLGQDEVFGTIEAVKTVSDLFMPVSGKVIKLNDRLEDSPELVNKDPYGEGWIIQVTIDNPADLDKLLSASQYRDLINS